MLGKRLINSNTAAAGGACTTDTLQILGDTSCVAYYKMSDATDESGNFDGTPTNVNFNVAGKFGNAGEFNGSSSYIDTSVSVLPATNYSVSMWVFHNSLKDSCALYTQYRGSVAGRHIVNSNANGTIQINTSSSNSLSSITATPFTTGVWQHLVVTKSSSTGYSAYIDGSSIGTWSNTDSIITDQSTQFGGDTEWSGNHWLDGSIDQVRIFNKSLSSTEVTTLNDEVYCQPTIVPTEHFTPVIWDGDSTARTISTGFATDFVWIKSRDVARNHYLYDSIRGANNQLISQATDEETTVAQRMTGFDSNGFDIGTSGEVNTTNEKYVAWNWKAGGADVLNQEGDIDSQVSANVDAGFSIVNFTSSGTVSDTIGHGLDSTPQMIIYKRTNTTSNWTVYTNVIDNSWDYLRLNLPTAKADDTLTWATDTTIKNISTAGSWIAYCFYSVDGYSKMGSFNQISGTTSVVTGFRPAFLMIKRTDNTGNWSMFDNKRGDADLELNANLSAEEVATAGYTMEFISNGFVLTLAAGTYDVDYIFMAFAEEVFTPITRNATNPFGDASELALYKFESDGTDSEGNYTTTTLPNVTFASGYIGNAAEFDGSNSKITLPSSIALATGNNDFSVSAWVYLDSLPTFTSVIATQSQWYFYLFIRSDGSITTYNGTNSSGITDSAAGVIVTGQWYHIAATLSSTNGKNTYVNGVNVATNSNTSNCSATTTGHSSVGYYSSNSSTFSYFLDGKIDQVRIFNRALDSGEILQLYNE